MTASEPDINHRIWQVVAAIPAGQVATYGDVARHAGLPGAARRVGRALQGLPRDTTIPWHRVINARGEISFACDSSNYLRQRRALEAEGIAGRVVSMPSTSRFKAQDHEYRDRVLPPLVKKRLSVEAGSTLGWNRWVGDEGEAFGVDHFGASGPGPEVLPGSWQSAARWSR